MQSSCRQFSGVLCETHANIQSDIKLAKVEQSRQSKAECNLDRLSHRCISHENIIIERNDAAESEGGG